MPTIAYEAVLTTMDGQPLETRPTEAQRLKGYLSIYQDFCRLVENEFRNQNLVEPNDPKQVKVGVDTFDQIRTFCESPLRDLMVQYQEEAFPHWMEHHDINERLVFNDWLFAAFDRALRSLMLWYEHYLDGDSSFQLALPTTLENEFLIPHGVYTFEVVDDERVRFNLSGGFQAVVSSKSLVRQLRQLWQAIYRDKSIELPPLYLRVQRRPDGDYSYRVSFRITDKFLKMVKRRHSEWNGCRRIKRKLRSQRKV